MTLEGLKPMIIGTVSVMTSYLFEQRALDFMKWFVLILAALHTCYKFYHDWKQNSKK